MSEKVYDHIIIGSGFGGLSFCDATCGKKDMIYWYWKWEKNSKQKTFQKTIGN